MNDFLFYFPNFLNHLYFALFLKNLNLSEYLSIC